MIYRIRPTKDTSISNALLRAVPQTASNYGFAETLEVYKVAGVSGAQGPTSGSQLSRILVQFSTGALDDFITSNPIVSRFKTFRLMAQHETTTESVPQSFSLRVRPVSGSWDEGRGMDTVDHSDYGYANWWKRTSTEYWTSRGGDFYASPELHQSFDLGDENVDLDVTSIFELWASGTANHGLSICMSQSIEAESLYQDYFRKSLYSRHSQWPDRRPFVEVRWDDFVGDDRCRMSWGRSGSLFLHNIVDGRYAALSIGSQALKVSIADSSGTLMQVTASATQLLGIYSASFALPSGTYSGSVFYDKWGSGSFAYTTGSFVFTHGGPIVTNPAQAYAMNVPNVRDTYDPNEVVRFNVFMRNRQYRQSVVLTASVSTRPDIIERCYYAVENESTRQRVIPFGTGSQQHTRLSYDGSGNYFIFPMANLHSGEVYRLVFLIERNGQKQVIDGNAKFRVR